MSQLVDDLTHKHRNTLDLIVKGVGVQNLIYLNQISVYYLKQF